jgi:RNA polymerase sigma-70 factor, ECF subfamily
MERSKMEHEAQWGDEDAAARILAHTRCLQRRAAALTRNRAEAEDLVQDTLERAFKALPRLRPGSNIPAWLNTLMDHRFIDAWRCHRRYAPLDAAENLAAPAAEPAPRWLQLSEGDVFRAMEQLPISDAHVLRLRYEHRLCYAEIARRLAITVDTVGTRLFRARRRLQQVLTARHLQPAVSTITPLPLPSERRRLQPPGRRDAHAKAARDTPEGDEACAAPRGVPLLAM